MKKRGGKKTKKLDADLDNEMDRYEPSDSDDGFDENERHLLSNAVGRRVKEGEEEEVLKVYSSSEDEDDEEDDEGLETGEADDLYGGGVGSDMDSDIEKQGDDLPDPKAWGSHGKDYYGTDYVDQDFLDFDNKEAAIEEEKEASTIQRRLLSHLEGTDFTLGLLDVVEDKKKEAAKKREEPEQFLVDEEKVEVDLSKLTKEDFIELMKRKNPEMYPIVEKCKARLQYLEEKIAPVLELMDSGALDRSKIVEFLEVLHRIILHYAINVLFYVYLKEEGERTTDHNVLKRIDGLGLLLKEMDVVRRRVDPQIDLILEKAANGETLRVEKEELSKEPQEMNRKERRKRKLELLRKKEEFEKIVQLKKRKLDMVQTHNMGDALKKITQEEQKLIYNEEDSDEIEEEEEEEEGEEVEGKDKRAITFEMLKNKGLTPKRKKENRNPRVKHRNKYKKALVKRKGQFREPRKEIKKYGGEISGINKRVSKSVRIK